MARRSAALSRAEKALGSARKRASDLRKKFKTDQPMTIATTIAGGALAGVVKSQNPLEQWGITEPDLIIGSVLIGYGLFSARDGQPEKMASSLGTGLVTAAAYRYTSEMTF
jgi:hypothetical protein